MFCLDTERDDLAARRATRPIRQQRASELSQMTIMMITTTAGADEQLDCEFNYSYLGWLREWQARPSNDDEQESWNSYSENNEISLGATRPFAGCATQISVHVGAPLPSSCVSLRDKSCCCCCCFCWRISSFMCSFPTCFQSLSTTSTSRAIFVVLFNLFRAASFSSLRGKCKVQCSKSS